MELHLVGTNLEDKQVGIVLEDTVLVGTGLVGKLVGRLLEDLVGIDLGMGVVLLHVARERQRCDAPQPLRDELALARGGHRGACYRSRQQCK